MWPVPSKSKPNILLLFPDQHRADWLPHNEELPLRMPNLAALMRRGVRFANAFTPSPICAPARACLASGRDYEACGVPGNHVDYPLDQETLYQRLRDAGYQVAGVGKFDLHKATQDWGLDGSRLLPQWGFSGGTDNEGKLDAIASGATSPKGPYMAYLHREGLAQAHVDDFAKRKGPVKTYTETHATPLPDAAYCDNWLSDNALQLLAGFETDRPWYLAVNFTGPHNPVDVTEAMRGAWDGVEFPGPVDHDAVDSETNQQIRRNYAAMLENIDRNIGRMVELIEARGELDHTLIVYSSDHGEMLGDHNRWAKGVFYQPAIGVPMVVAGPGVAEGVTRDALVALQDLTATFLERAGAPELPEMDGRTLSPLLAGQVKEHRPHVRSGLKDWRAVYDGRFKLVRDPEGVRLFDRQADPHELADIAAELPQEVDRLMQLLRVPSWKGEEVG
ncbi:MAG TPA: sulfatase-like hydrolase/transferase [Candidatus Limnocylindrales bacterium]